MTKFDPDKFIPDTSYAIKFPWKDVKACFADTLSSENFKGHDKCPECGMEAEKLVWINFVSPEETWKNLCGREGQLSICPACRIQVEFIISVMN